MTYVCITGNEQSPLALEQRLERVLGSHPRVLCELRLDFLDFSPVHAFSFLARLPADWAPRLILTQRLKASGPVANGACSWDVNAWQSWWKDVMALRPWFAVDLDWLVLDRLAGEALGWRGTFRSRHAFFSLHATLEEAEELLPAFTASAREHNAGVKLACPVSGAKDLLRLARLSEKLGERRTVVAMGAAGRAWRWSRLAGDVSYFAAESALSTAPGQDTFADVLPYLSSKQRPELYVLLGDNPNNHHGEKRWNRAFLRRGAHARYVNAPCLDEPGPAFAADATDWMEAAGISGASITKPFKLSFPVPTNTLKRSNGHWESSNTDALAVAALLERHGFSGCSPVIAGGGGAARAVAEGLTSRGFTPRLWVREGGKLGAMPDGEILISTWPGEFQEALVEALPAGIKLVIDAQFSREDAPLQRWCAKHGVAYEPGTEWWRLQARAQDQTWFGPSRLGPAREALLQLVPSSKSETLRALAVSAALGVPMEIERPSVCHDTEIFSEALEQLGASVDRHGTRWTVFPPPQMHAPVEELHMGEGATGFRILAALSTLMKGGPLRLTGEAQLLARPHEELFESLGAKREGGTVVIPVGGVLPARVALERSSQFATGFLIAGAAKVTRGELPEYRLRIEGERRSESYLQMTLKHLSHAGLELTEDGPEILIRPGLQSRRLRLPVPRDASSLAFLEVLAQRWKLDSFFSGEELGAQGDAIFPELLGSLAAGESRHSLRHFPDLAPPLWAAAVLMRKELNVVDCPQLRLKESDRALLLVQASAALGASAELTEGGFRADFRNFRAPENEIYLRTDGDHRLAMAFALVGLEYKAQPDRKDCVRKSFPEFWNAIKLLQEAMPG